MPPPIHIHTLFFCKKKVLVSGDWQRSNTILSSALKAHIVTFPACHHALPFTIKGPCLCIKFIHHCNHKMSVPPCPRSVDIWLFGWLVVISKLLHGDERTIKSLWYAYLPTMKSARNMVVNIVFHAISSPLDCHALWGLCVFWTRRKCVSERESARKREAQRGLLHSSTFQTSD